MKINRFASIVLASALSFGLIGCQAEGSVEEKGSTTAVKAMETGKLALADADFDKAKSNFELAVAEEKENMDAKNWLQMAKNMDVLSTHLENNEIDKADAILSVIKEDELYGAMKSQIDGYEAELTSMKAAKDKLDDEIAAMNQHLDEGSYDEVIEQGTELKAGQNMTEEQLTALNSIVRNATAKKDAAGTKKPETPQEKAPQEEYKGKFFYSPYTNSRFGFTVEVPATFTAGPAPDNNDGREFYSGDAVITAYGSHINIIEDNETIETYYNRALDNLTVPASYQKLGTDWYVVSYMDGSNIVYEKAVIGEDIISHLTITYPSRAKAFYDPMVTHVSKTFKGGQTEL
ncbi:hypothetical protein [Peribacillus sp. SCS-37]|uniref:hypothetical protein n=1 Tax=Paraperibacillus esterisolvens TaxID=3115296 RepID=UPI0039057A89